jgi:uncharacterized membrane protein SirB2
MDVLKIIHVSSALLSVSFFIVRGVWMLTDSSLFDHKLRKILPHIIDTVLLVSAIAILVQWKMNPFDHAWLMAKIIALMFYIGFGMIAFRFGNTKKQRLFAWIAALVCVAYIVQTALTKNAWVF